MDNLFTEQKIISLAKFLNLQGLFQIDFLLSYLFLNKVRSYGYFPLYVIGVT